MSARLEPKRRLRRLDMRPQLCVCLLQKRVSYVLEVMGRSGGPDTNSRLQLVFQ